MHQNPVTDAGLGQAGQAHLLQHTVEVNSGASPKTRINDLWCRVDRHDSSADRKTHDRPAPAATP